MKTISKKNTRQKGRKYEKLAEEFLLKRGFEILERNWQAGHREIDLIARDGSAIAFIEVKGAKSDSYGHPAEKMTPRKKKNLIQAAEKYIIQSNLTGFDIRFDLITILDEKLEYYRDAFWGE